MTVKKEKMDDFIQIRCTKEQKQIIAANAARYRMDASVYLRDAGLEGYVPKWVRELQGQSPESQPGIPDVHEVNDTAQKQPHRRADSEYLRWRSSQLDKKRHRA